MLELRSVTAGYGESMVLREVDFAVGDGEVVALLGPNGAGKTTLLRTATGFVKPRSGRVEFGGADLTGSLITVFPVTDEVLIQTNLTMKEEKFVKLETDKKVLPREGTPVKLVIEAP